MVKPVLGSWIALVLAGPALAQTGSAGGIVLDSLLRPIPLARVDAFVDFDDAQPIKSTRADGSGQFVLGGLPLGELWLRFSAERHTTEWLTAAPRPRQPAVVGLHRVLYPAGEVSGRVVDGAGAPVAGASVVLLATESAIDWSGRVETATDAQGEFACEDAPLGALAAWVHVPGSRLAGPFALAARCDNELLWKAEPGRKLQLRVMGVSDEVTAAARVRIESNPTRLASALPRALATVRLDEHGAAMVGDLPPTSLWVRASGGGATFPTLQVKGSATHASLRAVAHELVTISGRLLDQQGRPVSDAIVSVGVAGAIDEEAATAGADGSFAFERLVPKGAQFGLRLWGNALALAERGVVYVRGSHRDLELRAVPTARVSGRVVDARGAPVAGALVRLSSALRWEVHTAVDGEFTFDRITAAGSPVAFEVDSPWGSVQTEREFELRGGAHREGVTLQLAAPARLQGSVRDGAGAPVPGASVVLRMTVRSAASGTVATITDADGRWVLQTSRAGKAQLLVREGKRAEVTQVELRPGAEAQTLDVVLR